MTDERDVREALAAPFPPGTVEFKPQVIKGNRALVAAYVDARAVMDRLDDVLGVGNWQTSHRELPDGSVACRLRLRINGEWVEQEDVGSPSDQPDAGDRLKASYSDALKRAAVKFGVGRYLYRLPAQWCDYDPVKKAFTRTPPLPDWALPRDPAATLREQMGRTGKSWEDCMVRLNFAFPGSAYHRGTKFGDLPADHVAALTRWLAEMPAATRQKVG